MLIGLGSNVGDRLQNLQRAVDALKSHYRVIATSRVYETAPMYVVDQPSFLNAAVQLEAAESPRCILSRLKAIEAQIGRLSRERNGPREVDLDLVVYGALAYRFIDVDTERLVIPHPRMPERRFVIAPLHDLVPDLIVPGLTKISDMLCQTNEQADSVQILKDAVLHL